MKYWFFAALFANILLLLWEFHYGAFDSPREPAAVQDKEQKQILLLSETPQKLAAAMDTTVAAETTQPHLPKVAARDALPPVAETEPPLQPATVAPLVPTEATAMQVNGDELPSLSESAQTAQPPDIAPQISAADEASAEAKANAELAARPPQATEDAAQDAQADPGSAPTPQQTVVTGGANTESASEQPEVPKTEVTYSACYTAERIQDPAELKALLDNYRPQLLALELSSKETQKNDSYLVYYPPATSLEKSIANAEMLRSDYGVSDLLVFREGELKGAISLGVFSNELRAKTAQSQFEKKGLKVQIRQRHPPEVHYSVKMRWNDRQTDAAEQFANSLKNRFTPVSRSASCGGDG